MSTEVEKFEEDDLEIEVMSKPGKKGEKILTQKQKAFLSFLGNEAGGDVKLAMKMAGYSPTTRPDDVLKNITEEIVEVANKLITSNSVKAVTKLVGVLDNPSNPGTKDIIAAAKEVLDRAGLFKKDPNAGGGQNIKADVVFILPPKEAVDVNLLT